MYLYRIKHGTFGKRLVEALEAISRQENLPLLFHCGVGKDRTGVLTAFLLTLLGVSDDDIIADYALTDPFMDDIRTRIVNDPATPQAVKDLPDFDWRARPESMELFLTALRGEYGSIEAYIKSMGAKTTLAGRLKRALLV
jgi:protein-tyrosine phosphatase